MKYFQVALSLQGTKRKKNGSSNKGFVWFFIGFCNGFCSNIVSAKTTQYFYLYGLTFVLTGISYVITIDHRFEYRALEMMDIILLLTLIAFGFAMYFFWVEWISVPSSPCP